MNRICRFDRYDAFPDQLNDDVLSSQNRQHFLPERCFLQGSSYRARVVDRQSTTAVQGNRDGSTLAGAQPPLRCEAHLSLRGNAYARIVAANGNPVAALLPLHPDRVRPLPERVGGRLAYEYVPRRGAREVLLQEEVLHLRGLSLAEDGVIGLSPLDCMREAVGLALAAEAYGARFYRNNARPGIVLKHPGRLSPDAGKRLKESWNSQYAGAENAHKTAVLEEGMDLISVGMTAEQAQFLETRKFQRNEIAAIFGVPPHKIGDLERATFSNIEHQAIEVVTDTIRPWAVAWEQAMTRDLFTEELRRTHMLAFNLDGLLRGDIESRYRAYRWRLGCRG